MRLLGVHEPVLPELLPVSRDAMGASYPEVATILGSAAAQKNLPGPYVVDAIPLPNKAYDEAQQSDPPKTIR